MKISSNSYQGSATYDTLSDVSSRDDAKDPANAANVQQLQKEIKKLAVRLKTVEKTAGSSPEGAAAAMMLSSQIASLQNDVTKVTNVGASTDASGRAQSALRQAVSLDAPDRGVAPGTQSGSALQLPSLKLDLIGNQINTTA